MDIEAQRVPRQNNYGSATTLAVIPFADSENVEPQVACPTLKHAGNRVDVADHDRTNPFRDTYPSSFI